MNQTNLKGSSGKDSNFLTTKQMLRQVGVSSLGTSHFCDTSSDQCKNIIVSIIYSCCLNKLFYKYSDIVVFKRTKKNNMIFELSL